MKSWGYSWLDCSDWSRLIYYRKWKWGEYQEDVQVQRTAKNVPKVFREQGMCFEKLVPRTLEPRHIKCKKLSDGRTAYITECTAFSDVFYWFLRLPEWKIILLPVRCNDVQNSISPPKQIRVRRIQLYSTFKNTCPNKKPCTEDGWERSEHVLAVISPNWPRPCYFVQPARWPWRVKPHRGYFIRKRYIKV